MGIPQTAYQAIEVKPDAPLSLSAQGGSDHQPAHGERPVVLFIDRWRRVTWATGRAGTTLGSHRWYD